MTYTIDESRTATNLTNGYAAGRGVPEFIEIHHWGIDGQSHNGVVNWFCTPGNGCGTSAHFVVSYLGINCIVSTTDVAWHAGDWTANLRSIGVECRPEATDADYAAVAWLIAHLRNMYGDLPLRPHSNQRLGTDGQPGTAWTECPGRYDLNRLDRMARGTTTVQGDKPVPIPQEEFSMADVTKILNELANIKSVLIDGYAYNGKQYPPISAAVFQTRDISRNTKIPLIQEVADSKTMLIALTAQVTALSAVIAQLAGGQGVTIDYERIDATVKDSVKGALADGIDITGEISVGGTK